MHLILRNSMYIEHQHRLDELEQRLINIQQEEGAESVMDQQIVREIFSEFRSLFGEQVWKIVKWIFSSRLFYMLTL